MKEDRSLHERREVAAAYAVHAFTASGAVLGFLALLAILEGDLLAVFLWLGLALFVDGIDGTLARKARVTEVTPNMDGATLDNVIDYFNYVAVPAMMIYWFGFVPEGWATLTAAGIMGVSCYTFANANMKTHDYYFSGFPALWNLVVLCFHILDTGPWLNLAIIGTCAVLTFVPWKYVHPLRVRDWRGVTIPVTVLWGATTIRCVLYEADGINAKAASPAIFWLWVGSSLYFVALSAWRSFWPGADDRHR